MITIRYFRRAGFTLLEAMLLLFIFTIISLSVGVSLRSLVNAPGINDDMMVISAEIGSELDIFRANAYSTGTWATTPSFWPSTLGSARWPSSLPFTTTNDSVTLKSHGVNKTYTRVIRIQQQDPTTPGYSPGSGAKTDFVEISISIGGKVGTVWVTKP